MNIVENIEIRKEYLDLAKSLTKRLKSDGALDVPNCVIAIAGESGSGKSTTALCLEKELKEEGKSTIILHMDSYFHLPPKDNHKKRIQDLNNVGPEEIDLEKLNHHISVFKEEGEFVEIPIVNYRNNHFISHRVDISKFEVLIVEGVYALLLENIDLGVFLERTYHDSLSQRKQRTREDYEPIVESVLQIEHSIVRPTITSADYIIDKNYQLR